MTLAERIHSEEKSLAKCTRAYLEAEYRRSHRVADTRDMSKSDLVFEVLRDRFGARNVAMVYA